jgi:hypothetical protein
VKESDYYNVFDRIYRLKKLDKSDFRRAYRDMLFDTIESNKEKFGTATRFRNRVKLYDVWKEK